MAEKGFPIHLIRMVQRMYQNTTIIVRKDRVNGNTPIEINKEVGQGCPLSPILFNIYTDSDQRLAVIKQNLLTKDLILNTLLFADDQVIMASIEDEL
jgi:hypothetical protein